MNFRTIHNLNQTILNNLNKVPCNVEVVVGVPRSGMLAAMLLGLHRDIAITDIDGLIEGKIMDVGSKTLDSNKYTSNYLKEPRKVLIIDDSFHSGETFELVRNRIQEARLIHEISYSCVYGHLKARGTVDLIFESLLPPHIFEWNLSRNIILNNSCLDLDGIICNNPTLHEDDDGDRYVKFIKNAQILWKPEREVGWIVTSRLERYRNLTEKWLEENNIKYRELIMLNAADKKERTIKSSAYFKAKVYERTGAALFIESSLTEAEIIATCTRRNVFCFQTAQFIPMTRSKEIKSSLTSPKVWFDYCFLYLGYLFKDFPENHLIVGPIKKNGRKLYRMLKKL